MRVLIDKNVSVPLQRSLVGHEVRRTDRLAWGQLKNGALLSAAEEAGFDLMVTSDQKIVYQQNLKGRKIALIVLGAGNWPIMKKYVAEIVTALNAASVNSYCFVEMPLKRKRQRP